jgi:hypothetical protein
MFLFAAAVPDLQLYALAAWSSPPSDDPLSSSSSGRATLVQLSLVQPTTSLLLTPLFTKRLCAVPLSEQLLAPGRMPPWQVRGGVAGGTWKLCASQQGTGKGCRHKPRGSACEMAEH